MAFFGLYVWHSILIYVIVRRLTGFGGSAAPPRARAAFPACIGVGIRGVLGLAIVAGDRDRRLGRRSDGDLLASHADPASSTRGDARSD